MTESQRTNSQSSQGPLLSIITPCWNRSDTIRRCLDSCLSQDFTDFEIVTVDDGSEDNTLAILHEYEARDHRVKVVALPQNSGVSVARNAGAATARGQWLVYLDSDDAMLPGGLRTCQQVALQMPSEVGVIGLAYDTDTGVICPHPLPAEGERRFEDYLQWMGTASNTDYLPLHRKECWQRFPWPSDRGLQTLVTLRILSQWRFYFSPQHVGRVYSDAPNRYTSGLFRSNAFIRRTAWDSFLEQEAVVREFGAIMRQAAPMMYAIQVRSAAVLSFIAGRRGTGLKYMLRYLRGRPTCVRGWGILMAGLCGPSVLLKLRARFG